MHANPLWRDTEKKQHSLGNIIKGPGGKETKLRRHNPRWQFRFRVHVQLNFQKVCAVGEDLKRRRQQSFDHPSKTPFLRRAAVFFF